MGNIAIRVFACLLATFAVSANVRAATLTVTPTNIAATVDLSVEGAQDWAHWGLDELSTFNQRSNTLPRIGNVSIFGTAPVASITNTDLVFTWTNGTPVGATNTTNQLLITGA